MSTLLKIAQSEKTLVLTDQLLFSGSSFLVTLFFAHFLAVPDFGVYASVMLGVLLLINLCNALVIQPFQVASRQFKAASDYVGFLLLVQCILLVVLSLLAYFVLLLLGKMNEVLLPLLLMGASLLLYDFFRKYLLGRAQLHLALFLDASMSLAQLGTLSYLLVTAQRDLTTVFLAIGVANSVALMAFWFTLAPRIFPQKNWRTYWAYHRKEGSWLSLVALVQFGSSNFFVISLGVLINLEALSSFRLIQTLFGVLSILFQTIENYIIPKAATLYTISPTNSLRYIKNISVQSMPFIGVVLLILFFFSTTIMELIGGSNYTAYSYLIKGMCLLYFIILVGYPIRICVRMLVMNKAFFTGHFISLLFSLLAVRFLLEHWQVNGVIIGLIANQLLMLLFWNYKLNQKGVYLWK